MTDWQERPWGRWKIVHEIVDSTTVKVLEINAGAMLSLQSHKHRTEEWHVVDGRVIVYTDHIHNNPFSTVDVEPNCVLLSKEHVHKIWAGKLHRLINPTAYPATIIEIITGKYDEDDITRYHDAYGRE